MRRFPIKKFALPALLLAVVGGLLHALPLAGQPVSQVALAAAARGIAAMKGLAGHGPAGWMEALAARLWRVGGAPALAWGECAGVAVKWTLIGFLLLTAAWVISRRMRSRRLRSATWITAALIVPLLALPALTRRILPHGDAVFSLPLRTSSELAASVAAVPPGALFANPSTLVSLLLFAPEATPGITPRDAAALSLHPPAWRQAQRTAGWTHVVLGGPVGEFRPLLEHLLTSPDWRLAAVTNFGYRFVREKGAPVASLDPETTAREGDRETAIYLAQIAERYDAIRRPADALACLDRALELAPDDVTVLSHAATFHAGRKRWQEALEASGRALASDPHAVHPKLVRSLALLETGRVQEAQNLCDEVLAEAPNDLYTLFLHARICRTLNDYAQEAATLERLIALSEKAGLSTFNYRIFLGQAYARQGLAEPALKNYRAVLKQGGMRPEQAKEIEDAITTIEESAPPGSRD